MDTPVQALGSSQLARTGTDSETFLHLLERAFDQFADQVAIEVSGKTISTYQLDEYCTHFAACLQSESGLQPGDTIAVEGVSSAAGLVAVYGAIRAGMQVLVFKKGHSLERAIETDEWNTHKPRLLVAARSGLFGESVLYRLQSSALMLPSIECLVPAQRISFRKILRKADPSQWQRPNKAAQEIIRIIETGHDQNVTPAHQDLSLPPQVAPFFSALIAGQVVRF